MPLPEFTDDEQYLINFVKSPAASSENNTFMWGYLIGGFALTFFGTIRNEVTLILVAFVLVCGFRIYEEFIQAKWTKIWSSIIGKYEAALKHSADTR